MCENQNLAHGRRDLGIVGVRHRTQQRPDAPRHRRKFGLPRPPEQLHQKRLVLRCCAFPPLPRLIRRRGVGRRGVVLKVRVVVVVLGGVVGGRVVVVVVVKVLLHTIVFDAASLGVVSSTFQGPAAEFGELGGAVAEFVELSLQLFRERGVVHAQEAADAALRRQLRQRRGLVAAQHHRRIQHGIQFFEVAAPRSGVGGIALLMSSRGRASSRVAATRGRAVSELELLVVFPVLGVQGVNLPEDVDWTGKRGRPREQNRAFGVF
mmetsp:Transcript_17344/g.52786  ORF Transcript_17344/g.52786 Transcript_17344/m.52786 type:complete len:264 (-) Transcript_17344:38-829(-)